MRVRIVSYSKSVISNQENQDDHESNIDNLQDLVAFCARVSNPNNQQNKENNEKLITYLSKNQHWSPFEMASICLEIETTRDIARQILRHRSFSFQEFSQRYAVVNTEFETRKARMQDLKNRQNSLETDNPELEEEWVKKQQDVILASQEAYKWAIHNGIAKEQARAVLPEGNTMSRLYVNGTLRSWIHYIQLRSGNGSQKEHQEVALACAEAISSVFPMIKQFIST